MKLVLILNNTKTVISDFNNSWPQISLRDELRSRGITGAFPIISSLSIPVVESNKSCAYIELGGFAVFAISLLPLAGHFLGNNTSALTFPAADEPTDENYVPVGYVLTNDDRKTIVGLLSNALHESKSGVGEDKLTVDCVKSNLALLSEAPAAQTYVVNPDKRLGQVGAVIFETIAGAKACFIVQ
ncbi:hypothetical protein [Rheinheimera hassiensis]|uniref:hypothetical protein n=1 Tax=Rheinheimera hassiensis TaxID=1193627 RepID=UPI001F06AD4F|nr:hypothetical protein [Rheinheimera hassiensis]